MTKTFHLKQGGSQCGPLPQPPCPRGYRCSWHCTPGVSEFCCPTVRESYKKHWSWHSGGGKPVWGDASIPWHLQCAAKVPCVCQEQHPSLISDRSPMPLGCGGTLGSASLFLWSLGMLLCPGCARGSPASWCWWVLPRSPFWGCAALPFPPLCQGCPK